MSSALATPSTRQATASRTSANCSRLVMWPLASTCRRIGCLPTRRAKPIAHSTTARSVSPPPTTSTSGIRCAGLNGWATTTRSGCLQTACSVLGGMPPVVERMILSGVAEASSSRITVAFSSGFSGVFSCTTSAASTACAAVSTKRRRSCGTLWLFAAPSEHSAGHAWVTYSRARASAPGAGSCATTSIPCARNSAAQLAPIEPVPTTATERTSCGRR